MNKHYAVLLGEASFTPGDLDLTALFKQVDSWDRYAVTTNEQR